MEWNEKEIVLKSIKNNGENFKFIKNDKLKNDREIILKAIKNNGNALKYIPNKFKDDDEIVDRAIMKCGSSIRFASNRIKNDRKFIIKAVSIEGETLKYLNEELRNDKLIVYQAVLNDPTSFKFATDNLKNDKEFIKFLFLEYRKQLEKYCKEANLNEKEIKNIFRDVEVYKNLVKLKLKNDKKFIIEILEIYPYSYSELKPLYKKDLEIIYKAIEKEGMNILYLPKELKKDKEFLKKLISLNKNTFTGNILNYLPQNIKEEILENIKKNITYLNKKNNMAFSINTKSKVFNVKYIANIYNIDIIKLMSNTTNRQFDD